MSPNGIYFKDQRPRQHDMPKNEMLLFVRHVQPFTCHIHSEPIKQSTQGGF